MGRLIVKWKGNTEEDSKGGMIGRIWQGVIQKRVFVMPVIQEERQPTPDHIATKE